MRIYSDDKLDFFEIETIRFGETGDPLARMRVKGQGFEGTCEQTWFDLVNVERFLAALRSLEESRKGEASIQSLETIGCDLKLWSVDRFGHMHLEALVSQAVEYSNNESDYWTCRVRFEIDPTEMPRILSELIQELTPPVTLT